MAAKFPTALWHDARHEPTRKRLKAYDLGTFFHRMRVSPCFFALAMALASPALAQPAGQVDHTECKAQEAAIERDMDLARANGQMLRRRQLSEELGALQARCETLAPEQRRAANIERLEKEIRELQKELDHAEEQLRRLKHESP